MASKKRKAVCVEKKSADADADADAQLAKKIKKPLHRPCLTARLNHGLRVT